MNHPPRVPAETDHGYSLVRFSSADYAPRERLSVLRETYGRTLQKVDIDPLSTEPFHAEAVLRRMPGLAMISCRRSAAIYRRGPELIDHDDVGLTVGLSSGYEARQLGRSLALRRADAIVMTGAEPALLRVPRHGRYISIRLPARAMASRVVDLEATYGRPIRGDDAALRLLIRYLGLLERQDGFANPNLRRHAVAHIHDLAALALGATRDACEVARNRGVRAARLCAIKEDIATHLDDADLSVGAVAARHGVMPRYVQRLFEAEGTTFTQYVIGQRLAWAHRLLADPGSAGQKVSTIAFNVGFGDLSYFNRMFLRRYGLTPSDLRATARSSH